MDFFSRIVYMSISVLCLVLCSFVAARDISLDTLQEYQASIEELSVEISDKISTASFHTRRCHRYDRGSYFAVSAACFLQPDSLPTLSFTEAVDAIIPYVDTVERLYETESEDFWYAGTSLVFDDAIAGLSAYDEDIDPLLLQLLAHNNIFINLPKAILAMDMIDEYTFYASLRDTTMYGPCRKTNYDIALALLNEQLLSPGEQLNMNKLIANAPGYCDGGGAKYLFYQGVCGGSTQLFWNALVNPYLYVAERHAHGEFWANFYGHQGEDASIYERSKQLIIENYGNEDIYFRTFTAPDGNTVLLSVYPKKEHLRSHIQKFQTGHLRADLVNTVTNDFGDPVYQQERESRYRGVNKTKDL